MDDSQSHIPSMPTAGNSPFVPNNETPSELPILESPTTPVNPVMEQAPSSSYEQAPIENSSPLSETAQPAPLSDVPPTMNQSETPQSVPDSQPFSTPPSSSVRKSRVLLILGLLVVVVFGLTVGYYFFFMPSISDQTTEEVIAEPTQMIEQPLERISYPSTNLIGDITSLLANDTYHLMAINNVTSSAGCSYNETIQVSNVSEDYSVQFSTSFANEVNREACEFEDIVIEHLDLYSIAGVLSLRNSLGGSFETVDSTEVPEKMLPQYILKSAIPYPTLMTVIDAYRNDSGKDQIDAEFVTTQSNGTYTFMIGDDGRIENVVYELVTESGTYVTKGEMTIEYTSDPIVLPTLAS